MQQNQHNNRLYSYLLRNCITPLSDRIVGTRIHYYIKYIDKLASLSTNQLRSWQNKKLRNLVKHAYENTVYYQKLFNENEINPESIRTIDDLKFIPPLSKSQIIDNYKLLIPKNIDDISYIKSSTGGSTGDPLRYLLDLNTWSFHAANTIIHWGRAGYSYGDKYIALGSSNLFANRSVPLKNRIYYLLKGKIGLDGITMPDNICSKYIDLIKEGKIKFIYGYASSIFLLANYAINHKIKLDIQACFPTSEVLTPLYKETIEAAFSCEVLNSYGAMDGGISSFEHVAGYHEVGYNTIINLNPEHNNNVFSAQLTDVMNYAMPFINYIPGDDYLIDSDKNTNYSYNGQIINEILGRSSDIIRLDNGNILTGPGFTILFKDLPVDKYKIEINKSGSIVCKIRRLSEFTDSHAEIIINTIKRKAGSSTEVELVYVNDFKESKKRDYFLSS